MVLTFVSLFAGLGLALLLLVAWLLIRRDAILVADLRHRLSFTRKGLVYVVLSAAIMLGSILLAQLISLAFGYSADQFRLAHSASFSAGILVGWVPLLLAPAIEELSWHDYGNRVSQEELSLPVDPIRFIAGLLSNDTFRQLQQQGLDIDALLSEPHGWEAQWLEVTEGGVAKRIRVSCSG